MWWGLGSGFCWGTGLPVGRDVHDPERRPLFMHLFFQINDLCDASLLLNIGEC